MKSNSHKHLAINTPQGVYAISFDTLELRSGDADFIAVLYNRFIAELNFYKEDFANAISLIWNLGSGFIEAPIRVYGIELDDFSELQPYFKALSPEDENWASDINNYKVVTLEVKAKLAIPENI